jgi:hypothetical protein
MGPEFDLLSKLFPEKTAERDSAPDAGRDKPAQSPK